MSNTAAYPKILQVGDKAIADLFDKPVEITEKLDGSQFGFGLVDGELVCRSKGRELDLETPDSLFEAAVTYIKSIKDRLPDNLFFYAETLHKPRHSTLAYDRTPKNYIAIFGATHPDRTMEEYGVLKKWADELEIDVVPLLYYGTSTPDDTLKLLETQSYLGGQKIEGVVVKRYEDWMFLGRILVPVKAGKYVSEGFKETHEKDWSRLNTGKGRFEALKDKYRSEARWQKAIQHKLEAGEFEGTLRDIGSLIKEIQKDLAEEEVENIKDDLYKIFGPDITRFSTVGFVEWFKEKLARGDFQDV